MPWIWQPTEDLIRDANVTRFMRKLGLESLEDFLRFSREENETFWDLMVREAGIEWLEPYHQVLDASGGPEWARWFIGGKLNIASTCLDRHVHGVPGGPGGSHVACIWEGEDGSTRELTFAQLFEQSSRLAHALDALGLKKGDRAALYMPMIPEVVTILYACFKLGLVVVPIFSGFGPGALATRLEDSGARILFTADSLVRRGKILPLKDKADQALAGTAVEKVVVYRYKGGALKWNPERDLWWDELLLGRPAARASMPLDSEDLAFIVYTSGTTGKPKGAVHTHAGCLAQMTKEIYLAFDHKPGERFFWVSDIGWMMGPWEIIGNHNFGGTILLYDGAPDYPDAGRFWSIIERHRITTFGISPTAIRLLMRKGPELAARHDLGSLRLLGSTGEPWDETSYLWFFENVGKRRLPIINISGGTEIVGCFLFPLPVEPLKPCSLGGPAPGMATEVVDESGRPVRGRMGYLVCTKPAPSMTRGIWKDPERYLETYWSRWKGVWYHGDWASVDEDGCWFLHGRADETFNVAGRKVGPAEIEQALIEHPSISEAAVIGVPDEITGEAIVAFVVPKAGVSADEALLAGVSAQVAQTLGPTLRPRALHSVPELP
ncbi:MAG: AMP-binding protein, partial [Acidobacteria bacterium]|nr:AMP-binding protein [Acidobacteriota bacterium]